MFADKNNHLIKQIFSGTKRRHGGEVVKVPQEDKLEGNEVEEKEQTASLENEVLVKQSYDEILPQYLFKNWTSQKLTDETTIHICAYNSDVNFVKYIVEIKDKKAFFPSFVFTPSQKGGFIDGESSDDPLDKSFESAILKFANSFYSNGFTGGDSTKVSSALNANEDGERSYNEEEQGSIIAEPSMKDDDDMQLKESEGMQLKEGEDMQLKEGEDMQLKEGEDMQLKESEDMQLKEGEDMQLKESEDMQLKESEDMQPSKKESEDMQPLPASLNKDKSQDALKYIGYLNINTNIYAFVKTTSSTSLNDAYTETILNELFHTFKVFDDDVDDSVRTLFESNAWLLFKDEPFSGYLCDVTNEDKQMKNVKKTEPAELTNVESIGDFYYFSFLPLDKENAKLYQRYAFFPGEYVCILDESHLEEYKKDKMSYAEDKSIYFKGDILAAKKQGHEFFAVRTPSQFTQY